MLTAGRGLVLVDGIDEVPERERERTRTWLSELMDQYDGDNRWLVTSRPSAVGEQWLAEAEFSELTLSAMGPAEVATFIRRWHAAARPDAEDPAELDAYERDLLTAVRTKPDLGRLATNPLMCGLVCALHRERRGYLPHGRKELYEAALSMLLSRRDRERDIEVPELGEDAQLDLLQRLAYWLIKNGRTEMARPRADDIIGRALPAVPELAALGDAGAVFDHFLLRSGLLREPAPDSIDFVHKTFQDFLGARAAVEEGDFGLLIGRAGDDQWEDVIRMAVALAKPRERAEILRGLLAEGDRASDRRTRSRVYLLAAACLEQATVLDPAVRDLVEQRTAGLIPPGNAEEARALAEVGPLILGLLSGPEGLDDRSAWNVAIAASNVASGAAIPFLAQFAEHPFVPVRSQLVWAWSRFDSAEYADEVIAHLKPDNLMYTVQSDEQLDQLIRLRLRPSRLDIRGGVSIEALCTYLSGSSITALELSHGAVRDLEFLAGQDELHSLVIRDCPALVSLAGIGGVPLRMLDIHIASPQLDMGPASGLAKLEFLAFRSPSDTAWDCGTILAGDTLQELRLLGGLRPVHGLTGLGACSRLRYLALNPEFSPGSAEDWREISSLPLLKNLRLDPSSIEKLPEEATLAGITDLTLVGGGNGVLQSVIHRLPEAFPQLHALDIGRVVTDGHVDVAPLAGLVFLSDVFVPVGSDSVRGADALPPVVKLHHLL
ncbi:NACHT domain-containing protein [Streptomyces sp. NPDC002054]|uniref:NACHT domain-containing protein n=1 Tax=Streptomyces sp. NPDC002054 TaxID=3154663 RepID=UPI003329DA57